MRRAIILAVVASVSVLLSLVGVAGWLVAMIKMHDFVAQWSGSSDMGILVACVVGISAPFGFLIGWNETEQDQ